MTDASEPVVSESELQQQIQELRAQLNQSVAERSQLAAERDALLQRIHHLNQLLLGHVSERRKQHPSLLGLPVVAGATAAEAEAKQAERSEESSQRLQRKKDKNTKKGKGADGEPKATNGGGRKPVNRELPILTEIIVVPADQRTGPQGEPLSLLDYEVRELEKYIPAGIVRLIVRREILGLPDTREEVIRAPVPAAIVPRGKYHDSLIIEAMARKFATGMPFYRVQQDLQAMGSDMSTSQLSEAAVRFGHFIAPISHAIRAQVLSHAIAHIDETTLPTQDGGRYLWAVLAGDQVFFHVGGRGGDELRGILGLPLKKSTEPVDPIHIQDRSAVRLLHVMADGFRVYDTVLDEARIARLSCWAHARRGFIPYQKDALVSSILEAIDELYRYERQAKKDSERDQLDEEATIALFAQRRVERSQPQLLKIKQLLEQATQSFPPRTEQRKAIDYILNYWQTFTAYAAQGDLPIDNNDAERALKMIVVGRKGWMFIGSEDAAPHMAHIFTLMESCRIRRMDPRAYLMHIVAQMHAGLVGPAELTPAALGAKFRIRD